MLHYFASVSRYDVPALVAALLCIAAIGLAAATVAAPLDNEQFSRSFEDPAATDSSPFDFDLDPPADESAGSGGGGQWSITSCVPFLLTPLFYGLATVGYVGVFAAIRRKLATEYALAGLAFLVPLSVFVHSRYTEDCFGSEPRAAGFNLPEGLRSNRTFDAVTQPVSPEAGTPILGLLVGGAFLLLVVAALATTVRQRSTTAEAANDASTATSSHDLEGVARVAGEAADRIEGGEADPGNAVYRAWQDMTGHLAVDDTTTATPAEFRAAALDAGMSRAHVETITDLFREVRYGGAEPTADREERAVAALRAIEDAYGGDDA